MDVCLVFDSSFMFRARTHAHTHVNIRIYDTHPRTGCCHRRGLHPAPCRQDGWVIDFRLKNSRRRLSKVRRRHHYNTTNTVVHTLHAAVCSYAWQMTCDERCHEKMYLSSPRLANAKTFRAYAAVYDFPVVVNKYFPDVVIRF